MKKILLFAAMVVLVAAQAQALNIKNSKHNLGSSGAFNYSGYQGNNRQTTQICIFCHTPHNAAQAIPLWNRSNPSQAFKLYTASPSLNIASADRNSGIASDSISLFCMSCHDGTAGKLAGRVRNIANETLKNGAMRQYAKIGDVTGGSGAVNNDLTQDHPVNFNYDKIAVGQTAPNATSYNPTAASPLQTASDKGTDNDIRIRTAMVPAGASTDYAGGTLKFFKSSRSTGAYLECATCHDPHGTNGGTTATTRFAKFLRKSNDSSSLCLTCHIK